MRSSWLSRLFPPPIFLARSTIGLDLSDRSAKFVSLKTEPGGEVAIERFGEVAIPNGAIEGGKMIKPELVSEALMALRQKIDHPWVIASLPEEETYVVELNDLPLLPQNELRSSLELQLEEQIPIPVDQSTFDYEITGQIKADRLQVRVTVVPTATAGSYAAALAGAGFWPLALEAEGRALARTFFAPSDLDTSLLIDLGATRISFFIIRGGRVLFSSTIKSLNNLIEEANKLTSYWENSKASSTISNVFLTGGQANTPGLVETLRRDLKRSVAVANPWAHVRAGVDEAHNLSPREALRYGTAVGLALRPLIS